MRKSLSLTALLTLLLVTLSCAVGFAAPTAEDLKTPPNVSKLSIESDKDKHIWLRCVVGTPANVMDAIAYYAARDKENDPAGYISNTEMQYSVDGGAWVESGLNYSPTDNERTLDFSKNPALGWNGIFETSYLSDVKLDSYVKARVRYVGADAEGETVYSDRSEELVVNPKTAFKASEWAQGELFAVKSDNLLPSSLVGVDLTQSITRAEMAGVVVKAYEAMSGEKATEAKNNPFSDTKSADVLKAYNLGLTTGVSANEYDPEGLVTREQAATMLTRMYKKVKYAGWTSATDANYSAEFLASFERPALFADDDKIADWAKDSVYFLKAQGIMSGVGDNKFAPNKASAGQQDPANYGDISREQALIAAKRVAENLR